MLDPKSDSRQRRLGRVAERRPGETDQQNEERLWTDSAQHLHQLLARAPFRRDLRNDSRKCLRRGGMRRPSKGSRRGSARNSGSPWDSRLASVARKSTSRSMPGSLAASHRERSQRQVRRTVSVHAVRTEHLPSYGLERLIHHACSLEPRLSYEEGAALLRAARGGTSRVRRRFQKALELMRRERKADLLIVSPR